MLMRPQPRLHVVPVTWQQACAVVDQLHRHHRAPRGHKLSVGVATPDGTIVGVAMLGRPVARHLDDGFTLEVTRVATDGTANAGSALYGAARRLAVAMGYRLLVTYTQDGESGASLRGAGWTSEGSTGELRSWGRDCRPRTSDTGGVGRTRWQLRLRVPS